MTRGARSNGRNRSEKTMYGARKASEVDEIPQCPELNAGHSRSATKPCVNVELQSTYRINLFHLRINPALSFPGSPFNGRECDATCEVRCCDEVVRDMRRCRSAEAEISVSQESMRRAETKIRVRSAEGEHTIHGSVPRLMERGVDGVDGPLPAALPLRDGGEEGGRPTLLPPRPFLGSLGAGFDSRTRRATSS